MPGYYFWSLHLWIRIIPLISLLAPLPTRIWDLLSRIFGECVSPIVYHKCHTAYAYLNAPLRAEGAHRQTRQNELWPLNCKIYAKFQ